MCVHVSCAHSVNKVEMSTDWLEHCSEVRQWQYCKVETHNGGYVLAWDDIDTN